ncbi:transglutaminase family protein [bacterium]|nr:transglutaminase family protein [bacterium]
MSIKVALNHHTSYNYDRPISVDPQVIRLRPAPHCRTPIESYSLRISPSNHFINWQQDPNGNFIARVVFEEKIDHFSIDVDLTASMTVINPFDFFIEDYAENFPFKYNEEDQAYLKPYLVKDDTGHAFAKFVEEVDKSPRRTIDFLVGLNQKLEQRINYTIRMEPGVQSVDQTLEKSSGSCRDSSWLLVQVLRELGLAARFVSGYLIQLTPDVKSLDGPSGAETDFTDLHAWTEVYLPGAGWVGLDPTSGLFTGEGHLPLAASPLFSAAAPISGSVEPCETEFEFDMSVQRIFETPRVTKPYGEEVWNTISKLGNDVDKRLDELGVKLTMGGEPTFVSIDDPDSAEWNTDALGEQKGKLAEDLFGRMVKRFSNKPMLHYGQGKWYPGEPLPRWAKTCYWRKDGFPMWEKQQLLAKADESCGHSYTDAMNLGRGIAKRLGVPSEFSQDCYEDALYHLWEEQRLPANVNLHQTKMDDEADRRRLARVMDHGLANAVGVVLPLMKSNSSGSDWVSGPWLTRAERIFLIPGDSPIGYRLPLKALVQGEDSETWRKIETADPMIVRDAMASPEDLRIRHQQRMHKAVSHGSHSPLNAIQDSQKVNVLSEASEAKTNDVHSSAMMPQYGSQLTKRLNSAVVGDTSGINAGSQLPNASYEPAIPFALCVESRNGTLHVFMPPTENFDDYADIMLAVEDSAAELGVKVIIEGYKPPSDPRVKMFSVTPDPGVIEVNIQPGESWDELRNITEGIYEDAYYSRLRTEKFELDGTHSGTGGGNHIVIGGPTPAESPLFQRPDLLTSLLNFWQNHPSLSYLFSGRFIGATSQAPRVDEGRVDALYELQIAFDEIANMDQITPYKLDHALRHSLTDLTGNTHRAEFCIDKLCSPDAKSDRQGLLELRGFEMPPHPRMSLTQQLLLRTLIARFWDKPYKKPLVAWGNRLHDKFMLPHYVWRDFCDVIDECRADGFELDAQWFEPHFEFRFPIIGSFTYNMANFELRQAIEPWNVLGEQAGTGGTARYVDSSVERLQVKIDGFVDERYMLTCNGRVLPFHSTGVNGQYAAGVRYRAWQPPNCLHPTIPVDEPLTFDLYDTWLGRSVDGCRYHVGHPGGLNPENFPVNSFEAQGRRASRFSRVSHQGGSFKPQREPVNPSFPMTLDLRRERH